MGIWCLSIRWVFEPSIAFCILLVSVSIMPVLSLEKIEACFSSGEFLDEAVVSIWFPVEFLAAGDETLFEILFWRRTLCCLWIDTYWLDLAYTWKELPRTLLTEKHSQSISSNGINKANESCFDQSLYNFSPYELAWLFLGRICSTPLSRQNIIKK